jgi:hypothetical protein
MNSHNASKDRLVSSRPAEAINKNATQINFRHCLYIWWQWQWQWRWWDTVDNQILHVLYTTKIQKRVHVDKLGSGRFRWWWMRQAAMRPISSMIKKQVSKIVR